VLTRGVPKQFRCVYEGSTGGSERQFIKTLPSFAIQSSSGEVAREVQGRYNGKFRHTNEGSTGGRNFGEFKCTNEVV
jgi:hypothetical protein